MDKFEMEQLNLLGDYIDELQDCFIDGDAYSRVPSLAEWRTATRTVHRLKLAFCELKGYATAIRQCTVVSIRERLTACTEEGGEKEKTDAKTSDWEKGFVEFTEKEIKQMPKKIKSLIIINKKRCRLRVRKSGENSTTYQIRFRCDGYDISACGKTIELAKENFIKKAQRAVPKTENISSIPTTFHAFATYYFENFRKEKVAPITFKHDMERYRAYLQKPLNEKPLRRITPFDCKQIIDGASARGKTKTASELYALLSVIFKAAIAHGVLDKSPLILFSAPMHEHTHGVALSKDEENKLFRETNEPDVRVAFALALYCGLRPNELCTATVHGEFIVAVNSKRHNRKTEYKRIPIIARLRPFLENGIIPFPTPQILRRRIKDVLPNHKLYDLRTTFYTRCQEYGVSDRARNAFVGHSAGKLERAYTDLSDEYLLREAENLNKW